MRKRLLAFLGDLALRAGPYALLALGATWRLHHAGREAVDRARFGRGPVIYAFTHGVILPLVYDHRGRGAYVLISESRDGAIIARVAERIGHATVRGSSTRGGGRAAVELIRRARQGYDLAITPDGPRGPRGSIAPGVALVAARSEAPIVPIGVAADRAWRLRSWDRFLIPHPGARVAVVYGEPIRVSPGALGKGLDEASRIVEEAIAAVERDAEELVRENFRGAATTRVPA